MPDPVPVLIFARLTILEAARRKLLLAVVALTVVVVGVTGWAFSTLSPGMPQVERLTIASQSLIAVVFLFEAVLALMSVLVAAPSISNDLESHLVLAVLARPVRRSELVLGKWLGLAALVVGYAFASGGLELTVVDWVTGYLPPDPIGLIGYVAAVGLVLLTLALLLSTRMAGMTAGIIPLIAYFMAWVAGILGGIGTALGNRGLELVGVISQLVLPTDGLWRAAVYAMEPAVIVAGLRSAGRLAAGNPFSATDGPTPTFLAWTVCWFVAMVALTIWSFRHREL